MAKATQRNQKTDIMAEVSKFYRVEARKDGTGYKGVIVHKASGIEMVVNVPVATDSAAVMVARSQLVAAAKRGAVPLA